MKKIYELDKMSTDVVIPQRVLKSINQYVWYGRPTGDFVYAVLCNNLQEAVARADASSLATLKDICTYVYNAVPSVCHGSPEAVKAHIEKGRILNEQVN